MADLTGDANWAPRFAHSLKAQAVDRVSGAFPTICGVACPPFLVRRVVDEGRFKLYAPDLSPLPAAGEVPLEGQGTWKRCLVSLALFSPSLAPRPRSPRLVFRSWWFGTAPVLALSYLCLSPQPVPVVAQTRFVYFSLHSLSAGDDEPTPFLAWPIYLAVCLFLPGIIGPTIGSPKKTFIYSVL